MAITLNRPQLGRCVRIDERASHCACGSQVHLSNGEFDVSTVCNYQSARCRRAGLGVRYTTEAAIGAVLQAESHGNSSTPSPQNAESAPEGKENKGISRGLCTWREAVARCHTSAQLAMLVQALEAAVAWDKSIMKANCQFCLCGDNEDQLLLCDGCDKGYHTYCFKPRMEKIPDGDWYCWECVNKARGERVCIVCGGASAGRTIPCALCARAYHQDCHYPPLGKNPRGKWYCIHCAAKAPPKKPRNSKKRESKHRDAPAQSAQPADADLMVPSPAPSHASTSTTADECASTAPQGTPEKTPDNSAILEHKHDEPRLDAENGLNHHAVGAELRGDQSDEAPPAEKRRAFYVAGNGTLGPMAVPAPAAVPPSEPDKELQKQGDEADAENVPLLSRAKKEKAGGKKLQKDMLFCKSVSVHFMLQFKPSYCRNLLCEMECHEHAWPFLLPVNTKQFPQYKKVIKSPMDLSTIKRKLHENSYKCKEEFASDVRLMFSNCEVFNEDDSPVGRAGHHMRGYFEQRWPQLT
ncbi:Bromodomain adjacent to zinc finger domain protein 2B [Eumeta japonica]|uniref:Bromodomain adjacent to zinc finger domain protein 2B n=1 Tax=Eumeta variegata TaxID=151549 RepID=A0A4C1XS34_EUMVA|nr:Bromodomain adjacent to zinc finger domain protein 2B [Eumeta japonica]